MSRYVKYFYTCTVDLLLSYSGINAGEVTQHVSGGECCGSWVPICFPCLGCLAMVIKPRQGLVTGATLLHLLVKHIANGCPQGGHLDST